MARGSIYKTITRVCGTFFVMYLIGCLYTSVSYSFHPRACPDQLAWWLLFSYIAPLVLFVGSFIPAFFSCENHKLNEILVEIRGMSFCLFFLTNMYTTVLVCQIYANGHQGVCFQGSLMKILDTLFGCFMGAMVLVGVLFICGLCVYELCLQRYYSRIGGQRIDFLCGLYEGGSEIGGILDKIDSLEQGEKEIMIDMIRNKVMSDKEVKTFSAKYLVGEVEDLENEAVCVACGKSKEQREREEGEEGEHKKFLRVPMCNHMYDEECFRRLARESLACSVCGFNMRCNVFRHMDKRIQNDGRFI